MKPVKHAIDTSNLRVVPGADRNTITEGSEWTVMLEGQIGNFINVQEIDLTGMVVQEQLFYPESFNIQRGPVPYVVPGNSGAGAMIELHVLTTSPWDFKRTYVQVAGGAGSTSLVFEQLSMLPGLLGSSISHNHVICGEWTTYTSSVSQQPAIENYPSSSGRFGSMTPVANDKMYYYRLFFASNVEAAATAYGLPAARLEIFGQVGKPEDLDYVMTLKRNVDLYQDTDED